MERVAPWGTHASPTLGYTGDGRKPTNIHKTATSPQTGMLTTALNEAVQRVRTKRHSFRAPNTRSAHPECVVRVECWGADQHWCQHWTPDTQHAPTAPPSFTCGSGRAGIHLCALEVLPVCVWAKMLTVYINYGVESNIASVPWE